MVELVEAVLVGRAQRDEVRRQCVFVAPTTYFGSLAARLHIARMTQRGCPGMLVEPV